MRHLPPLPLRLNVLWLNARKTMEIVLDNVSCLLQHEAVFFKEDIYLKENMYSMFSFCGASSPMCWFSNKEFLCITHTVEHNCISPSRTVGIQLYV